jgi:hypothetical protein
MKKLSALGIIVGAAALVAAPISVNWPSEDHAVVTINSADAKVGKPLPASTGGRDAESSARATNWISSNVGG